MSNIDFHPDHCASVECFLSDEYTWAISDNDVFNVCNMSDSELMESVIEDILSVNMYEIQLKTKVNYTFTTLIRFINTPSEVDRIKRLMNSSTISVFVKTDANGEVRIDPVHLQAAMDFCGVWYSGYSINTTESVIIPDRSVVNNVSQSDINLLVMDIMSNAAFNKTAH